MFHAFYDVTTGKILRVCEGVDPELNKAEGEDYFSSSVFYDPDKWAVDVSGEQPMLVELPPAVIDPIPEIRRGRNRLLTATDWTQMPDVDLTEAQLTEARTYRQALRDMMSSANPVFPTPPEWMF